MKNLNSNKTSQRAPFVKFSCQSGQHRSHSGPLGLRAVVGTPQSPFRRVVAALLSLTLILPNSAWAGAYVFAGDANGVDIITHPTGYNGTGGQLDVNVCIVPGSPNAAQMEIPVQNVIRTWNRLRPTTGNLQNNGLTPGQVDFESIALHEVGHCIGLAHVNAATESGLALPDREYTKATRGPNGVFDINAGIDGIRGSNDDVRGDDVNLHWFNSLVNNPFTINLNAPIDNTTYSNDLADLPAGHNFAANAERQVGAALGFPNTQAVMQQGALAGETDRELIADGVASIRLAASGVDETEGTADDYTLNLVYQGISNTDCDINISFNNAQTGFAVCQLGGTFIAPNHLAITSANSFFNTGSNWFYNQVPNTLADLQISKTDSADPVAAGASLAYTITVNNSGPDEADTVVVTETLPSDVTFVSTAGCNEDPNGVPTCTLGNIAASGSDSYVVNVTVNGDASGTITNSVAVSSQTTEDVPGDETDTETTTITAVANPEADLSITKADSVDPVTAGNNLTYTIAVSNAGPDAAQSVVVTDNLPAGTTLISTSGCAEDPNGAPTCTLGNINASSNAQYTITVAVDEAQSADLSNTATVASSTDEANPGDESATETTVVNELADLAISKSDSADPVLAGSAYSYTVSVDNNGPSTATNVVATDTLPAGVTFVSTSGCAEDPNGVPTCSLGSIASGGSDSYTINVTADAATSGSVSNAASVTGDVADNVAGNNSATETTQINQPAADLSITKSDDIDPIVAGNTLTYTLSVANAGPQDAANVVVTDTLPAGVTFVSTSGCSEDPAGVPTCTLGNIANGGNDSYSITVTVDADTSGTITNNASVSSDTADNSTGNNATTENTTVNAAPADLSITKSDSTDPVVAGNSLSYTVTVNNAGPNTAENVVVTDTLPAGVTFVSTSGCNEDPNGVPSCTLGDIANAASDSYMINVTVDSDTTGSISNSASVTSNTADNNAGNNSTTESTQVNPPPPDQADLTITKSDSVDPVTAGNNLTYTINVANAGPDDATDVVVTDNLPSDVSLVSTSGCAEDPNGVPICTLGTIASGTSDSFTVLVNVDSAASGNLLNAASVSSSTADPATGGESTSESTAVNAVSDLAITKTDSSNIVTAGDSYFYTVSVANSGPSDAANVVVTDTLPAGVTFVSTSGCNEDPNGVPACTLGTIAASASDSYQINVTADANTTGTVTNNASVTTDSLDNNSANDSTSEQTTIQAPSANLSITKSDSVDPVVAGNSLVYTINVANAGPNDASNVVVTESLPAGVTFVSTSGCAEDPNGVPTCSLGTIANGGNDSYTVNVNVDIDTSGTISNGVSVAAATNDPANGNNSVTETTDVTAAPADVSITKSDSVDPVIAGQALVYTLTVNNAGPNTAADVVVTDTLPAGVTFVSTSGCIEDPNGVPTCTLGDIANAASDSYTINVTVDSATSGTITNTASVATSTADNNSGNDSTTENTTVNQPIADLAVTKSDSADPIVAGNTLTYTVNVANNGPQDAVNVIATDTLPPGVTFNSTSGCNEDPNGVPTCTLGNIANGGSDSYTIGVTVDVGTSGNINNSVSVSSDTADNTAGNDTATQSTTVTAAPADLSITKSDSADPVLAGAALAYTVTVNNAGPNTATDVVVTDTLPAGVTFVSTSGCNEDPNGVPSCTLGDIANSASDSYTINVTVDSATSGSITNNASVASATADNNAGNNSTSESTTVNQPVADLAVTKSDSVDPIVAGNTLVYTIAVANNGPQDAASVVVTDTLPAGVTFNSTSGCAEDPNGVPTCTLGTIANGGSDSYTVNVTVDTATIGSISNNVSVASATNDNVAGNNSASESTTVNEAPVDLSITKSDSADPVLVGSALTYTVTVNNAGPNTAANVVVTDNLPSDVTFVSSSGCNEDPNGVPSCTLGSIASGGSDSYTIDVTVNNDASGTLTNNASVATSTTENATGNNSASETTGVTQLSADLAVTKSDSVDPVVAGNTLTYTVNVSNSGPNDASDVVVTDTLPAGVTFVSTSGCNEDPNGVPTCTLGSIANGTSDSYSVNVTVDVATSGTINNQVSVASGVGDPNAANNTATESTSVTSAPADLAISKADSTDPVLAGSNFSYTVAVQNNGPNTAQDVVVTDTLPAGVTFISTSGCAEDPNGLPTCTLGNIGNGVSESYTINVSANAGASGLVTNNASVSASTTDNNSANNSTSEGTTINQPVADLAVTKSDSSDPIVAGNTLIYTVSVANNGPQDATGVVVTDTLPAGVTFNSTSGCAEDPNGVPSCTLGTIANGGSDSYTINVTVDTATTGTINNNVSVASSTSDNVAGNNSAAESTTVTEAPVDLSISKSDSVDPVLVGSALTYTVTVNNAGPNTAANVVVTDTLPSDVTFVSTTGCNEDPNGVPSCTLGSIGSGASDSYSIDVTVNNNASGTLTNIASVVTSTTENVTGNNSTSETTAVSQLSADLAITKSDSVDPVVAGSPLSYTVNVSNNGPNDATSVVVTDTLPAGVTFVSTSGCNEDPNGVPSCTLGSIANGGSDSYQINVTVDTSTSGTITNNASVASAVSDPVAANNSTSEGTSVTAAPADLSITKSDSADPVLAGGSLAYTITVNNAGPNTAQNVVVTDTLPAGVTLVSTSGCAEDPAGVPTCSLGNIGSGGSDSYVINVSVDSGTNGSITNNASVSSNTADNNAGNNNTSESTQVNQPAADLSISKSDSTDPVTAGANLRYTVTVNNAGPNTADNVVVTDSLPSDVTFVSTNGCNEDPNGVPTCSLGSLANGGSSSFTIDVTVNGGASGTLTNNASVASGTNDPVNGNNSTSETTTVSAPAVCDIAISPTAANYNAVTVGITESRSFTVSNSGNADCSVSSISVAGTDFSLNPGSAMSPTIVPASGSITVIVDYTPSAAGADNGNVSVSSNDPAEPTVTAGLTGRGAIVCDVDASGQIDRFDINQIFAARNQPSSGAGDRRDANSNGIINVGDARRCARQCDNARCQP